MGRPRQREIISGPAVPGLPFSTAVAYGDLLFISGLIGRDSDTRYIAEGDVRAQTTQTLVNLQSQCERAGTSLDRALKLTVYLTDMTQFAAMNEAYRAFFPADPPARTTLGVAALPEAVALVEIDAVVAL